MNQVAVVTGAGSGVGRAVALELARQGWKVAIVGRRVEPLHETARLSGKPMLVHSADIRDEPAVNEFAERVGRELGDVTLLVNSAGINVPKRAIAELSFEDFRTLVDVNLTGAFLCIKALLPMMRGAGGGTIVNINSIAGLHANAVSGAGYSAAKFGLRGLTQTINEEERKHGIRACSIFPGEINTPLMDKRPDPPTREARDQMLQAQDVADCVMLAINLPQRATIEELTIRPTNARL